ncbi:hypothetical protein [Anaerovibrio sp.]|uniref:hypothetical protein n=1 Tax=Anaerovibrio sp. TaxID=1872532 RepID=UPI003F172277
MDMLDMAGFFGRLERWMDTLASLAPFLVFVTAIIIGNLGDKKKPKVKKSKPFPQNAPLPDIRRPAEVTVDIKPIPQPRIRTEAEHRPHHPAEYEEVHNPYQRYLEEEGRRQAAGKDAGSKEQGKGQQARAPAGEPRPAGVMHVSLVQAIVSAEVLGRPKALQRRRR